jgi:hypothetical protein
MIVGRISSSVDKDVIIRLRLEGPMTSTPRVHWLDKTTNKVTWIWVNFSCVCVCVCVCLCVKERVLWPPHRLEKTTNKVTWIWVYFSCMCAFVCMQMHKHRILESFIHVCMCLFRCLSAPCVLPGVCLVTSLKSQCQLESVCADAQTSNTWISTRMHVFLRCLLLRVGVCLGTSRHSLSQCCFWFQPKVKFKQHMHHPRVHSGHFIVYQGIHAYNVHVLSGDWPKHSLLLTRLNLPLSNAPDSEFTPLERTWLRIHPSRTHLLRQ